MERRTDQRYTGTWLTTTPTAETFAVSEAALGSPAGCHAQQTLAGHYMLAEGTLLVLAQAKSVTSLQMRLAGVLSSPAIACADEGSLRQCASAASDG